MSFDAVLFDLDGTLVDTAPDLVGVLNQLLVEHGRPRMPYAIARNEVSNGAAGLLRLGFADLQPGAGFDAPGASGLRSGGKYPEGRTLPYARSELRAMTNREVDEGALAFLNKKPPIRDDSSAA